MSKSFFGRSFSTNRTPPLPRDSVTPIPRKKDEVSLLYELGLLNDSDKKQSRRREKGKDREEPQPGAGTGHSGGARVAGSRLGPSEREKKKSKSLFVLSLLWYFGTTLVNPLAPSMHLHYTSFNPFSAPLAFALLYFALLSWSLLTTYYYYPYCS